ncbi:hypothetical protein BH09ACT8_BH09ACT8_56880 [soil metagenome]
MAITLAALVVPATAFLTAGASPVLQTTPVSDLCCPEIVMAAPLDPVDSVTRYAFASSVIHTEAAGRA